MTETAYYTRKNLISAFLLGLVIGFGSYYTWINAPFQKNETEGTKATSEIVGEMNTGENVDIATIGSIINNTNDVDIKVSDQAEGMKVVIDSARLGTSSWIAVRETRGSELANILGAGRYDAGNYESLEIELSRNTVDGNQYYVVIYEDDGDRIFDWKKDKLVKNGDEIIKFGFKAIRIK